MNLFHSFKQRWLSSSLLPMYVLLTTVTVLALRFEGVPGLGEGVQGAGQLSMQALPFFLIGIALAGMLQVLVPAAVVGRWMGEKSGLRGLAIGITAGGLMPGGPFIAYPIAASLMSSGAGLGPMAGFMASRNVIAANRLFVWDIPFLGAPLAFARLIATLVLPPLSGLLVPPLYRMMPKFMRRDTSRVQVEPGKRDV